MTATPKTVAAAAKLLVRYADAAGEIEQIEARRGAAIARANADADAQLAPLLKELGELRVAIEPWWTDAAEAVAPGRKSAELGGCILGTRAGRPKLAHNFDSDDKAIDALKSLDYPLKLTTRVKYSLDRTAIVKLLSHGNKMAADLAALGFSVEQSDSFFIERAKQPATITG